MVQQIARRICQSELWHQFKATITLLVCSAALRQIGATISAQHIFSKVRPSMWKDSSMQSPFQHTFSDAFILKPWFARGCVLPFSCHLWNNLDEGVLCEFHEKQWQTESQAHGVGATPCACDIYKYKGMIENWYEFSTKKVPYFPT